MGKCCPGTGGFESAVSVIHINIDMPTVQEAWNQCRELCPLMGEILNCMDPACIDNDASEPCQVENA